MVDNSAEPELLDIDSLSQQSGVQSERIARYADRGLITGPDASGMFDPADIVRLRLINTLIESGLAEESLFQAVSQGIVDFGFAGKMLEEPVVLAPVTVEDACSEAGIDYETFTKLMLAIGFAPQPRASFIREDMWELLRLYAAAVDLGLPADVMRGTLQSFAINVRRIADASRALVRDYVETPILREGLSYSELLGRGTPIRRELRRLGYRAVFILQRRMYEQVLFASLITRFEEALAHRNAADAEPFVRRVVCFIDISGFTERTETVGDMDAASVSSTLVTIVQNEASVAGGDLVKALGDGAMVLFDDAGDAARTATRILTAARLAGLPPVRAGISAGPVISQDGDYFGRTVNRASRLLTAASPGQVIASEEVLHLLDDPAVNLVDLGKVPLKGMSEPVGIFSVEVRSSSPGE